MMVGMTETTMDVSFSRILGSLCATPWATAMMGVVTATMTRTTTTGDHVCLDIKLSMRIMQALHSTPYYLQRQYAVHNLQAHHGRGVYIQVA